jgi:hypothetical protein
LRSRQTDARASSGFPPGIFEQLLALGYRQGDAERLAFYSVIGTTLALNLLEPRHRAQLECPSARKNRRNE